MTFSEIVSRINGTRVTYAWFDDLRDAGIRLEQNGSVWEKFSFGYADFSAAATTFELELVELAAKETLEVVIVKSTTAFSGGSVSAVTLECGISGQTDRYFGPYDLFATVSNTNFQNVSQSNEVYFTTQSVVLKMTSVGDDLDALTAGAFDVWVKRSKLP
jgi:hypothetical protein